MGNERQGAGLSYGLSDGLLGVGRLVERARCDGGGLAAMGEFKIAMANF